RGMFLISFLTGLVGFAASFLLTKESSRVDSSVKGKKFIAEIKFFPKFFRHRGVLSPSLAAFFYAFSIAVVLLYYPLIASDRGLSISEISITMMLWNSSFILRPFVGRLSDRIGRVLPIVTSLWGACLVLLAAYFAQGFTAFATLLLILGITRNTLIPVT
ncbi:MAG: hypothetical protein GTN80_11580, partial [Nitrososphaeria archaeon]|nr:hypothetical protein [Nitrososphaeria archaeon]NIN53712.1 hypothetical protein [Nitrososphaeria archaeon]NIQ34257.1 hypothetical protein [Nitrososphaeria archaeon]